MVEGWKVLPWIPRHPFCSDQHNSTDTVPLVALIFFSLLSFFLSFFPLPFFPLHLTYLTTRLPEIVELNHGKDHTLRGNTLPREKRITITSTKRTNVKR